MAVVANPLVVRIFINSTLTGRSCGWSERWPIWETNWDVALQIALEMVQARQNVLSSNAYIQWGCLGSVTPPYYEQTVVTDPLYPLPQWGPAAFDMQGVLFDLNTSLGENAPRLLKAIEATAITPKQWIYSNMTIPYDPPALGNDLTIVPKDILWQNTLATFRKYASTQQPMSDGHHGEGEGYWVNPYQLICYAGVSNRRWGPMWRRMSWEAVPYVNAPQFSPCGTVVTVNRFSYIIPCRFGENWTLRRIHYYDAPPDAAVMTYKTPFCCWARSKEYTDFSGVGEARKEKTTDWTWGNSFGNAPGVMWTGPPSYFLGLAPEPPIPTPSFMLPTCDAPAPNPWMLALQIPLLPDDEKGFVGRRLDFGDNGQKPFTPLKLLPIGGVRPDDEVQIQPLRWFPQPFWAPNKTGVGANAPGGDGGSGLPLPPLAVPQQPIAMPIHPPVDLVPPPLVIAPLPFVPVTTSSGGPSTPSNFQENGNISTSTINIHWGITTTAGSTLNAGLILSGSTLNTSALPSGWQVITTQPVAAGVTLYSLCAQNAAAQTNTMFTANATCGMAVVACEQKGAATSSLDKTSPGATGSGTSASSGSSGTTSQALENAIAIFGFAVTGGASALSNGYTLGNQQGFSGCAVALAYKALSSTASTSTVATLFPSGAWAGT